MISRRARGGTRRGRTRGDARRGPAPARAGRGLRRPGSPRLPRPGLRTIAVLFAVVLVLGGAWLWFRDSSLVAVRRVVVTGTSGPEAAKIRRALAAAARNMTTLDVNMSQLRTAVAPYPDVKSLQVSTHFPHGMRIRVIEQLPVAMILDGGQRIAVAGDGTLLHDAVPSFALPSIPLRVPPGGTRLTGYPLTEVHLLAAAPYQLLAKIGGVSDGTDGLVAQVRGGPNIYFGDSSQLSAKWTAAAAVLASPGSDGAVYVDVTDPNRPAAGTGSDRPASAGTGLDGPVSAGTGTQTQPTP